MDQEDLVMTSPSTPALSAPPPLSSPGSELANIRSAKTASRALTSIVRAKSTARALLSPHPHQYEHRNHQLHSSLVTQVWKYYDNSGYDITANGGAGQRLKLLRKCRCLFCDQVMNASPVKMAIHIANLCPIADPFAKQALRCNKTDALMTRTIVNPQPKPRRPYELMTDDDWQDKFLGSCVERTGSTTNHSSEFEREAARYSAPLAGIEEMSSKVTHVSHVPSCTSNTRRICSSLGMGDVVKRVEEMTNATACEARARTITRSSCEATQAHIVPLHQEPRRSNGSPGTTSLIKVNPGKKAHRKGSTTITAQDDKENLPEQTTRARFSTAKKRRFGNPISENECQQEQHGRYPKKPHGSKEPTTKRLFCEEPVDRPRCDADCGKSDLQLLSNACDTESMARDLTVACILENVPMSFLHSTSFHTAAQRHCATHEIVNFKQLSDKVLQQLALEVDGVADSMRISSSALTFIVKRESQSGSYRAMVYLVNDENGSMFLSYQQKEYQIVTLDETEDWLVEVRDHYLQVSELCGRYLHVCVSDFPIGLQNDVFEVVESLIEFNRLFGGCMSDELSCLQIDTLEYLPNVANVLRTCVEISMLVDKVECLASRQMPMSQIRISIPKPRDRNIYCYVLVLKQMLRVKDEVISRYQSGRALKRSRTRKTSESASRLKTLLSSIQDHWHAISDTLDLLVPFAIADLLKESAYVSSRNAIKLTSGVFFCLELWLFVVVSRTSLLSEIEKTQWTEKFSSYCRSARMDHQLGALLLDPRIAGAGLSCAGIRAGRASIMAVCERVAPQLNAQSMATQLADFVNKTGVFSSCQIWLKETIANPISFWRSIENAPELRGIALLVCSYTPISPAPREQATIPDVGSDLEQNIRIAQIKHHLRTREAGILGSTASSRSLDLLRFIHQVDSSGEDYSSVDLGGQFLSEMEQFPVKANDDSTAPPHQSILESSELYAMSFRSLIDEARDQSREHEKQDQPSEACKYRLTDFSDSWIDCSHISLQAIRNAIGCLLV
ncbi:hypothetical protein FI667_g881, partial [Globisporangium splendens]